MTPTDREAGDAAPAMLDLHKLPMRPAWPRAWGACLCVAFAVACDSAPTVAVTRYDTDAGVTAGEGGEAGRGAWDREPADTEAVAIDDALAVAAGGNSSCVIRRGGQVWCWGGNGWGVSDGPRADPEDERAEPVDLTGPTTLAMGQRSLCGLLPGGRVRCLAEAGSGISGEVPGLTGITSLSAGWDHVCTVDEDGRAWCWGSNGRGQVGLAASRERVLEPVEVAGVPLLVQVSAGDDDSCACDADGGVWCWGAHVPNGPAPARIEGVPPAVEVAVRWTLACARQSDGGVTCWGGRRSRPPEAVEGVSRATGLVVAADFACALRDDGRVVCWGANDRGQLGRETGPSEDGAAGEVTGLTDVTALSAGQRHVCALTRSGHVYCWGESDEGQTGRRAHRRSLPTPIAGVADIVDLSLSTNQACARASDGRVSCWGRGDLVGGACQEPVPFEFTAGSGQVVVTSFGGTCIRRPDGTVVCWSEGETEDLGLSGVVELAAGWRHLCARHADGGVSCWGRNDQGQLGDGTTEDRATPDRVPGLHDISQIVATGDRTCVRQRDQALCFGRTAMADTPEGGPMTRPTPVAKLGPVSELFGSESAVCARHTGDVVSCWGETQNGVERAPGVLSVALPGPLRAFSRAALQTCALLEGGALRCWRTNYVEDFTTAGHPVAPPGVDHARAVAGAAGTTCAVTQAGGVACWGSNYSRIVRPDEPCFHTDPNEVRR